MTDMGASQLVIVHGSVDADVDNALERAGLRRVISLGAVSVWMGDGPGPVAVRVPAPLPAGDGPERLLLTVVQAAGVLGVGRTTAYQLIRAGELEVVHVGRSARVPADSLPGLIGRLRSGALAAPAGRSRVGQSRVGPSRPAGRISSVGPTDRSQRRAAATVGAGPVPAVREAGR